MRLLPPSERDRTQTLREKKKQCLRSNPGVLMFAPVSDRHWGIGGCHVAWNKGQLPKEMAGLFVGPTGLHIMETIRRSGDWLQRPRFIHSGDLLEFLGCGCGQAEKNLVHTSLRMVGDRTAVTAHEHKKLAAASDGVHGPVG